MLFYSKWGKTRDWKTINIVNEVKSITHMQFYARFDRYVILNAIIAKCGKHITFSTLIYEMRQRRHFKCNYIASKAKCYFICCYIINEAKFVSLREKNKQTS